MEKLVKEPVLAKYSDEVLMSNMLLLVVDLILFVSTKERDGLDLNDAVVAQDPSLPHSVSVLNSFSLQLLNYVMLSQNLCLELTYMPFDPRGEES
jgi:hypothetical protein